MPGPDDAVAKSSANVGSGFASRWRVLKGPMGKYMDITPSSSSLTSNRVTTNY